jgi:hypothetical protein
MFGLIRFLFTGWMLRILIILAVVYGLYFYQIWPFNKNVANMEYLEEKYCQSDDLQDQAICDCVLKRVKKDMNNRFTNSELEEIKGDRMKSAYALQKSLEEVKESAKYCLEEKGQTEAWRKFTTELATLDNKLLGTVGNLVNKGADLLNDEWESRKQEKSLIDAKY